ncbi:PrgH/EprH family type III secretion apparatus protein [Yersinia mollaretii]|nr:PrgH/EprH family type III secretion apparatus protein [Yersinia mollaretii]CNJ24058.1 type III secretion system needle complex protein PrgH [Yersinia mollaretii]CNK33469.1 type III secretion system needle complex protein PrgH [Yersinia mollaretii]CQQ67569.1 type III secretion system needle complex protein PrgH [Yersinia mollaretii]
MMKDTDNRVCIMKIASGPLSGNELMLKVGTHRIIIGPEQTYRTETSDEGLTTYYLPSDQGHYEVAITSDDAASSPEQESTEMLYLTLSGDCPDIKQPVVFQELMLTEHFPVVIKMLNTPWNTEEILPLPAQATTREKTESRTSTRQFKPHPAFLAGIALVVLAAFTGLQVLTYNSEGRKVKTLETLLQGSSSPLTVTTSGNGQSLVLVKTQRDLDWSTQRLLREHYQEPVIVKKTSTLESEVENQLNGIVPGLLKVDLSLPCQPVIRRLKGNYPQLDNKHIQQTLSSFIGCSTKSQIESYSSAELFSKAEQGLTESNVPWRVVNKNSTPIFIINASLTDKQTLSAIDFADEYTKKWGIRHIQFSISLTTNHLAGKSFINNANGYVLLGNNHWYFNPVSL